MKYYLADILTFTRLILAIVLIFMAIFGGDLGAGFLVFILGELTDAFDGTCAAKWPFPKGRAPKYRKYAAKYDMWIDALLALAMALFFTLRVSLVGGLVILIGYGGLAVILDLIVYGKVFGHPDDFKKNSLMARNFPLAKKLILARRRLYLFLIALASAWTFYASTWPLPVKITITIIAVAVSLFLWFFLAQRRHNISRDAVKIEQKLSKK
ncbi:CDP-alcohol phosphatidyltransferase family protein [Candidatus Saccharibacteria bacterium]|nr:CDP-alcohol phosphatidyltransferase family protein [Candidatus Saccharibacteria bacterium]